jgi:LysR substrate binding domain
LPADAAIEAAIAGIGVTHVLSYQITKAVEQGLLRIVLTDFEPDPMPVHLIHAGQGLVPRKLRSFIEFAAPRLRKILTDEQRKLEAGELRPSGRARKAAVRRSLACPLPNTERYVRRYTADRGQGDTRKWRYHWLCGLLA